MERVGVVGCGQMGSGIAEVAARAGYGVRVVETSAAAVEAGRARLESSLARAEKRGRIDSAEEVLSRLEVVEGLDALPSERQAEVIGGHVMRTWTSRSEISTR